MPVTLAEAVLALLLSWPAYSAEPTPEAPEARQVRLTAATIAITEAASARPGNWQPVQVAAVLLTLGWYESRFAAYVGEGRCSEGPEDARCDPHPVTKVPRARSYWQAHQSACPLAWTLPPGSLAELRAAAGCASRLWVGAYYRCRRRTTDGPVAGAFAGYAGGAAGCRWDGGARRARKLLEIASILRAKMSRPSAQSLNVGALDAGPVGLPGPGPVPPAVALWAGPAGARSSGAKPR